MQVWQIVAIGVAIGIIVAAVAWFVYERTRSRRLRERFGPEYDRRVHALGDRRRAESELVESETKVRKLKARPLSIADRTRFFEQWRLSQARFVDDPKGAVEQADLIVTDVMRVRGFAVDDPYDRTADLCAAYPNHAESYREASDIVVHSVRGRASTEDLRKAFISYRSLFDDMVGGQDEELKRAS